MAIVNHIYIHVRDGLPRMLAVYDKTNQDYIITAPEGITLSEIEIAVVEIRRIIQRMEEHQTPH